MNPRKEKIRDGLEIDYDLLDSDLLRCYIRTWLTWSDGDQPRLVWVDYIDREDWTEEKDLEVRVMMRTLDDETELAEGRRFLRLQRYTSYACLADLARRKPEPGEFVIRKPPDMYGPMYVSELDEARLPDGLGDPDVPEKEQPDLGIWIHRDIREALRFSYAEAVRLTTRIMLALGYDLPDDNGNYYEPVRVDVAEELHARAIRRPRPPAVINALVRDLAREPQE